MITDLCLQASITLRSCKSVEDHKRLALVTAELQLCGDLFLGCSDSREYKVDVWSVFRGLKPSLRSHGIYFGDFVLVYCNRILAR